MSERKIVVTGLGALTPLGLDVPTSWEGILKGQTGIERIQPFDEANRRAYPAFTGRSDVFYAAFIKGFNPKNYISDLKLIQRRSRPVHLSVAAAQEAIRDSGLPRPSNMAEASRIAVMAGSGMSQTLHLLEQVPKFEQFGRVASSTANMIEPEQAASTVNKLNGFMGPTRTMSAACESGPAAVISGIETIKSGSADVAVVIGVDSIVHKKPDGTIFHPMAISTYDSAGALATGDVGDPSEISTPFDQRRRGFVIAELAASMVIETEEHAKKRGARIYAEIAGYGESNDAGDDTNPSVEGQLLAMNLAALRAGVDPEDVKHINTHGTGTPVGDPIELTTAMLFWNQKLDGKALCATKSMTGHGIGGTGVWEIIEAVLSVRDGVIPPTPNFRNILDLPDDLRKQYGISVDYASYPLFSSEPRYRSVRFAESNSFGFGGHNGAVLVAKP